MNDYQKALSAAREAHKRLLGEARTTESSDLAEAALRDLLAALDAARGQAVAWYRPSEEGYDSAFRDASTVARCDGHDWAGWVPLYTAPPHAEYEELVQAALQLFMAAINVDLMQGFRDQFPRKHARLREAIDKIEPLLPELAAAQAKGE